MALQANKRNGDLLIDRNERTMPKWVTEQTNRIGPRPPPPPLTPENGHVQHAQPNLPPKTKTQPEPDYEVIEFSHQQYSNAPQRPNSANSGSKTPDSKLKCTLCGSGNPWVTCDECAQQIFCASCDDMFHKHPKRKNHQRKTMDQSRPPLPPKFLPGQAGAAPPPVAPPRRNKRGFMTPLMQRKDQGNSMTGPFPVPASPTPSMKSASWQKRFGSLPRGLNLMNRPLPETPKTPSESSRSTTPKSVFDNIQRPPSVVLEKIKNKANATLDRMQILQQRYRQQKEQMERERSGSVTDQNISAFDQWSNISQSPSHFPSGSISSGINSSHLDLTDDTNFNLFHQRQMARQHHQMAAQRANQLGSRGMSSSVFNLNQMNRKQPQANNGWMNNPMQQAQSMAQLNCANCHSQQQQSQWRGTRHPDMHSQARDPWSNQLNSQQHLNRSNLSLNIGAGYMMQPQHNGMYPPPVFMNQRGLMPQMYPQPFMGGMPVMNPGLMGMPPSTSRTTSRVGSRMTSPAMSRHSVTLRRKQRSGYIDDEATDDEDSDEDDRRSITSGINRSHQRRMSSASQIQLDDAIDSSLAKSNRNRVRGQRRDSIAKSVNNDWAPGRRASTNNNNRSVDSGFNSPLKPSRIYSDLDSEGSGTRALVQAKIEQKLKEDSFKQKESNIENQSPPATPMKITTGIQTPAVKQTQKQETLRKEPEKTDELDIESRKPEHQPKASDSENEEEETDEQETENDSEEDGQEQPNKAQEQDTEPTNDVGPETEEDDLGPPPSTPDHEWECEFCTFVNEPNIKICLICCKTPCANPKKAAKSISPPKQIKTPIANKDKEKDKSGMVMKKSSHTSTTSTDNHEPTKFAHNIQSPKIDSVAKTEDKKDTTLTSTLKTKESVEDVWATLDENIQATAHEVSRKAKSEKNSKVSTACGTSSKSTSIVHQEVDIRKSQAREIGTSPPPQTISTQTYDTLPLRQTEAREDPIVKPSQTSVKDVIQQTNFAPSSISHDLKSFETEVLNNIHNISHIPSQHQQLYHQHHPFNNERQRYRSNNDLHMDDSMSMDIDSYNGLGRRQPSINELMLFQRTSSQMHSPLGGSIYDLPCRELTSLKYNDMDNHKESDIYKHTTEELNAALKYCGPDMHPLVWLRDNWPKLIQTVQSLATKYGQERAENTIGTISQMEAREALCIHTGNIWQAVSECIEQRQRKYREISNKGNFSREDIVTALTTHQGNVELAQMDLGRSQLKPFLMRIWGSPGGVENESGSVTISSTLQSSPSTQFNMDKDIHNFLSANATDCMQIPNITGAYHCNNPLPSPFDLPTSLSPSFENNNHMPDNTSSYSADSKDYAPSPFPLDDSILGNKSVLKDLETLIGNMEQNQQKQNEHVLRSINDMITNIKQEKSGNDYDTESMRILTKSPITSTKLKNSPKDNASENEADVKNFVWQHIQEIVPNLVQQVEMELMEDNANHAETPVVDSDEIKEFTPEPVTHAPPPPPPIDQDEFLMEEVIKPNIKTASFREELPPQYVYAAEIATFQMTFDKGLEKEHAEEFEWDSIDEAVRNVFKMFKAPDRRPQIPEAVETTITQLNKPMVLNHNLNEHEKDYTSPEIQTSHEMQYMDTGLIEQALMTTPIEPQYVESIILEDTQSLAKTSESPNTSDEMGLSTETKYLYTAAIHDTRSLTTGPEALHQQHNENNISKPLNKNKLNSSNTALSKHGTSLPETPMYTNTPEFHNKENDKNSHIQSEKDIINKSEVSQNYKSNKKVLRSKSRSKELVQYKRSTDEIASTSFRGPTNSQSEHSISENLTNLSDTSNELIPQEVSSANHTTLPEDFSVNTLEETSVNPTDSQDTQISEDATVSEIKTLKPLTKVDDSFNSIAIHPQSETLATISSTSNTEINSNDAVSGIRNNLSSSVNISNKTPKKTSKIPVRRTASNISLVSASKLEQNQAPQIHETIEQQNPPINNVNPTENPKSLINTNISKDHTTDEESEEEELLSMGSETSATEIVSRGDQFQSPNSTSEIFLTIQHETAETVSTVAPSTSSSTLYSVTSISSGLKSPNEFIPSGDPTKQNLSDLVKDTQRLIKQMKDEISIDDFESSTDDDDYTDEYTDEYDDDGEEEEEEDDDWEEEEDDEEFDDQTEDITEENDVFSNEEDPVTDANLPNLPQQDLRDIQNTSVLSNITESSDHSLTLPSDHIVQNELMQKKTNENENNLDSVEDSMTYIETELSSAELPVETVISINEVVFEPSTGFLESENNLAEMPVETVLMDHVESTNIIVETQGTTSLFANVEEQPTSIAYKETENSSAELPAESVIKMNEVLFEPSTAFLESENNLPEMPVETVLMDRVENTNSIEETQATTSLSANVEEQPAPIANIETEISSSEIPAESGIEMTEILLEPSMAFLESENNLPEMPVETVLIDHIGSATILEEPQLTISLSENIDEQQNSIEKSNTYNFKILESELETENNISELPVETVIVLGAENMVLTKPETTQNLIAPLTTSNQTTNITQSKESIQSNYLLQTEDSSLLRAEDDLPTTSNGTKSNSQKLVSSQDSILSSDIKQTPKLERKKSSLLTKDNLPSMSNGTKPKSSDLRKKSIEDAKTFVKKPLTTSKIPKPKDQKAKQPATPKPQNELKKKLTTRSKSFSGPPTPIGISSVKTISQRFINPIQNMGQAIQKNQPTVSRKSSITDAINKLTKPSTSSEAPSTSALFRSRTQPRLPKKKYHETCFSDDDYETSFSEEEIEPLEIRVHKFSVPVFRAYPSVQEPEEINTEELVNKFMKEELAPTIAQAQIAAALVAMKFQQDVSLWAAKECSDLDHAIALLKQECELCSGTYALNEMVSMLKCIHKCCKQCAKTYFTVQITERSINDCSCPFCKLPELHNPTEHEDENLEYFSNLDIFLKSILETEVHELFQRKLRDRTLLKDPNFKWCVQCSSGFFARPKQKRLICPDCGSVTCAQCRKTWQKQHEGISCDQFLEWESANDPEVQAIGVKQHLDQNGIDCPKCKFRYSLARGGCMHFTCTQCKYEFCYGCAKPFRMGAKCTISSYCAKLGLHAHHPRNCLFYLRDKLPVQLQILLKTNGIPFEIDDPLEAATDDNEPSSSNKIDAHCLIAIQKETPTGLVDTKCNNDVPEKHAGMCRTHYVEYLTAKVAKAHIDPLPIFDLTDCVQELRRRGIALPERGPWDTDEIYKKMCAEVIQKNIPLDTA